MYFKSWSCLFSNEPFTVPCLGLEPQKTLDFNIYGYDVLKHSDNISKYLCTFQSQENTFISRCFTQRYRAWNHIYSLLAYLTWRCKQSFFCFFSPLGNISLLFSCLLIKLVVRILFPEISWVVSLSPSFMCLQFICVHTS